MTKESKLKLLIDSKTIKTKVKALAERISKDYMGKSPVFVGVLNGAFILLSDLVRELKLNIEIDFLKIASYGNDNVSSGKISLLKDLDTQVKGKDVIVVEDIIDSGLSVKFIYNLLMHKNPNSIEFITLLLKKGVCKLDFDIKYIGFRIPDKFIVGYGLDYAQCYRNLKSIYIFKN